MENTTRISGLVCFVVLVSLAAGACRSTPRPVPRGSGLESLVIQTASGTEREIAAKAQLERLLRAHDVTPWVTTREILIDEADPIPHSHPVLTLNANSLGDDLAQLATFLHEQFHWHSGPGREAWLAVNAEFRELFPDAPLDFKTGGARNADSTISHLVICDLEFQAMTALVGESEARRVLEGWTHYSWIYDQVLNNPKVRETNARHGWLAVPAE